MFKAEWPTFVFVALQAVCLVVGKELMLVGGAVWVMAARTLNHSFFNAMMRWHRDLRTDARMARDAEFLLLRAHHCAVATEGPLGLGLGIRMDVVAAKAGNTSQRMLTQAHVALFPWLLVAGQTHVRDIRWCHLRHRTDGPLLPLALHVLSCITVAG